MDDPAWRRRVPQRRARWPARAAARRAGGGATIVLASDRAVQRLNARHRGRNKPTNVLTFEPAGPGAGRSCWRSARCARGRAAGRRPAHHLAHLVVHGALHLQGHDHHHAGEARRMEMAEARILRRLGVRQPLETRHERPTGAGLLSRIRPAASAAAAEHSVRDSIAELVQEAAEAPQCRAGCRNSTARNAR